MVIVYAAFFVGLFLALGFSTATSNLPGFITTPVESLNRVLWQGCESIITKLGVDTSLPGYSAVSGFLILLAIGAVWAFFLQAAGAPYRLRAMAGVTIMITFVLLVVVGSVNVAALGLGALLAFVVIISRGPLTAVPLAAYVGVGAGRLIYWTTPGGLEDAPEVVDTFLAGVQMYLPVGVLIPVMVGVLVLSPLLAAMRFGLRQKHFESR